MYIAVVVIMLDFMEIVYFFPTENLLRKSLNFPKFFIFAYFLYIFLMNNFVVCHWGAFKIT